MRNRYFTENQVPRTIMGNEAHQTTISGSVINCRKDVTCQGNGAKNKYNKPNGTFEIAPLLLDTSTSSPKPDLAELEASLRLRSILSRFPKLSSWTLANRVTPRKVSIRPSAIRMANWRTNAEAVSALDPITNAPPTAAVIM